MYIGDDFRNDIELGPSDLRLGNSLLYKLPVVRFINIKGKIIA